MLKHKITAMSPEPNSCTKTIWAFDYCPDEQVLKIEYYYDYTHKTFQNPEYSLKMPANLADLERWAAGMPMQIEIISNYRKDTITFEQYGYAMRVEELVNAKTGIPYSHTKRSWHEDICDEDLAYLQGFAESDEDYWGRPFVVLGCEWTPKIYTKFRKLLKKFADSAKILAIAS